jgi:hypothetical protein
MEIRMTGRDVLAAAIETAPLDQDTTIILERADGCTRYNLPAVCHADGSEVVQHGVRIWNEETRQYDIYVPKFATPEEHVLYQTKRRKRIAQNVRRQAMGRFE